MQLHTHSRLPACCCWLTDNAGPSRMHEGVAKSMRDVGFIVPDGHAVCRSPGLCIEGVNDLLLVSLLPLSVLCRSKLAHHRQTLRRQSETASDTASLPSLDTVTVTCSLTHHHVREAVRCAGSAVRMHQGRKTQFGHLIIHFSDHSKHSAVSKVQRHEDAVRALKLQPWRKSRLHASPFGLMYPRKLLKR